MPRKSQMNSLGGREEFLGAGRGILPAVKNDLPDFTGQVIGVLKIDPKTKDLTLEIKPDEIEDINTSQT